MKKELMKCRGNFNKEILIALGKATKEAKKFVGKTAYYWKEKVDCGEFKETPTSGIIEDVVPFIDNMGPMGFEAEIDLLVNGEYISIDFIDKVE